MTDPCRQAYERAFTGSNRTAATWAAFKAGWRPQVVTDAMVEAGAKALAGDLTDPHNAAWGRKWARSVLEAALMPTDMDRYFADIASSPEKARAFLQDAGILDKSGQLAEPYRSPKE